MTRAAGPSNTPAPPAAVRKLIRVLPYIGAVVSLIVLAAPAAVDRWEAWQSSMHISTLSSTVDALPAGKKQELLEQARLHNARLAGRVAPDAESAGQGADASVEPLPYEEQLRTDNTSMMAWLEIPGIDLKLPIYHGTGESELAAGVGHLPNTSLPVGGPSTHCVLTAHSGMAGARMFDDIRLLQPGDRFVVWTLGDPLAYEVVGSEEVLPNELDTLHVEPDKDLCTLVTCTPYGVNSHRLLVHARRCEYDAGVVAATPARVTSRALPLLLAAGAAVVAIAIVAVVRRRRLGRLANSPKQLVCCEYIDKNR